MWMHRGGDARCPTEADLRHNEITLRGIRVGDKVKLFGERHRYTVRAASDRFLVCTKPFNPLHTTIYTIIDRQEQIRGRENLIFGMGFETDEQCAEALERLTTGETEVSHRHYVPLLVESVS